MPPDFSSEDDSDFDKTDADVGRLCMVAGIEHPDQQEWAKRGITPHPHDLVVLSAWDADSEKGKKRSKRTHREKDVPK